jgi:hypothetical protein
MDEKCFVKGCEKVGIFPVTATNKDTGKKITKWCCKDHWFEYYKSGQVGVSMETVEV